MPSINPHHIPTQPSPRPWWQAAPCPAWCEAVHRPTDHPDDRLHYGPSSDSPLGECAVPAELAPVDTHGPHMRRSTWQGVIEQHYREIAPTVRLSFRGKKVGEPLTPGEAAHLGLLLLELARLAGGRGCCAGTGGCVHRAAVAGAVAAFGVVLGEVA